jgi:hypothetical protein
MTEELARRLEPNDFHWKKSVAGCADSHIRLWRQLVDDPDVGSYMIMEDDARIRGCGQGSQGGLDSLPAGFDIVYLGGILPHNRPVIDRALAGLPPTMRFIQVGPTIHFCAYAYILSKAGARKLLNILDARGGIYTSLDLIMCQNAAPEGPLLVYAFNPMIAGCSQDDDPVYHKADFNNMLRVDKFDSDIWTNSECWGVDEYGSYVRRVPAWAKKAGMQEINPGILHGIIRDGLVPVIVGSLPRELVAAVPLQECERDEDAWRLIDVIGSDAELRERYLASLRAACGLSAATVAVATEDNKRNDN